MIPFSYAIVDDLGEVIRKHRWSVKEAKWFTENNPNATVVKLDKPKEVKEAKEAKEVKEDLFQLVGGCLF